MLLGYCYMKLCKYVNLEAAQYECYLDKIPHIKSIKYLPVAQ